MDCCAFSRHHDPCSSCWACKLQEDGVLTCTMCCVCCLQERLKQALQEEQSRRAEAELKRKRAEADMKHLQLQNPALGMHAMQHLISSVDKVWQAGAGAGAASLQQAVLTHYSHITAVSIQLAYSHSYSHSCCGCCAVFMMPSRTCKG